MSECDLEQRRAHGLQDRETATGVHAVLPVGDGCEHDRWVAVPGSASVASAGG